MDCQALLSDKFLAAVYAPQLEPDPMTLSIRAAQGAFKPTFSLPNASPYSKYDPGFSYSLPRLTKWCGLYRYATERARFMLDDRTHRSVSTAAAYCCAPRFRFTGGLLSVC